MAWVILGHFVYIGTCIDLVYTIEGRALWFCAISREKTSQRMAINQMNKAGACCLKKIMLLDLR